MMSVRLYAYLLCWDGDRGDGCAKAPGVYRHLSARPAVHGLPPLYSLDYAPETGTALIRPVRSGEEDPGDEREMTDCERAAAARYLRTLQEGAAEDTHNILSGIAK
jgi:hypothetical protein